MYKDMCEECEALRPGQALRSEPNQRRRTTTYRPAELLRRLEHLSDEEAAVDAERGRLMGNGRSERMRETSKAAARARSSVTVMKLMKLIKLSVT